MKKIFEKKRKGSLTLEATLVLPLVILSLLFMVNILNICMIQTCMQQAINNTAKKISQDSYLVYRIAGEEAYESFLNGIADVDSKYKEFEEKATDTKNKVLELEDSMKSAVSSFETFRNTPKTVFGTIVNEKTKKEEINFDVFKIIDFMNEFSENTNDMIESGKDVIDKSKETGESIKTLYNVGKENIKYIALKLLTDTGLGLGMTGVVECFFDDYRKKLNIPTSKISNISFLHSNLNPDGSFTYVLSYKYVNPFSFINNKSLEYSVLNKNIRMTNAITIKPFVGKSGTSLVSKEED